MNEFEIESELDFSLSQIARSGYKVNIGFDPTNFTYPVYVITTTFSDLLYTGVTLEEAANKAFRDMNNRMWKQ